MTPEEFNKLHFLILEQNNLLASILDIMQRQEEAAQGLDTWACDVFVGGRSSRGDLVLWCYPVGGQWRFASIYPGNNAELRATLEALLGCAPEDVPNVKTNQPPQLNREDARQMNWVLQVNPPVMVTREPTGKTGDKEAKWRFHSIRAAGPGDIKPRNDDNDYEEKADIPF